MSCMVLYYAKLTHPNELTVQELAGEGLQGAGGQGEAPRWPEQGKN